MSKKVRSMRGEEVDFDLIHIKEQLNNVVPVQDVKLRKNFIEDRMRRRVKKVSDAVSKIDSDGNKVDTNVENKTDTPTIINEAPTIKQKTRRRSSSKDSTK